MKRNPTLMEALDASIAKEKAKFPLGVIVARNHADRYALMGLEAHPDQSAYLIGPEGRDDWEKWKKRIAATTYFVVIDSHWDPDYCYLWVELMGLGDPSVRGWLRSPETKLTQVDLEPRRSKRARVPSGP